MSSIDSGLNDELMIATVKVSPPPAQCEFRAKRGFLTAERRKTAALNWCEFFSGLGQKSSRKLILVSSSVNALRKA